MVDVRACMSNVAHAFKRNTKQAGEWSMEAQKSLLANCCRQAIGTRLLSRRRRPPSRMWAVKRRSRHLRTCRQWWHPAGDRRQRANGKDGAAVEELLADTKNSSGDSSFSDGDSGSESSGTSASSPVDCSQWESTWHDTFQHMLEVHEE